MSKPFVFVALLATLSVVTPAAARNQGDQPVTKQSQVTTTATIKAIDPATRSITLRSENGDEDTFTVGPAVARVAVGFLGKQAESNFALRFDVRE